jgi:hypothetical protein
LSATRSQTRTEDASISPMSARSTVNRSQTLAEANASKPGRHDVAGSGRRHAARFPGSRVVKAAHPVQPRVKGREKEQISLSDALLAARVRRQVALVLELGAQPLLSQEPVELSLLIMCPLISLSGLGGVPAARCSPPACHDQSRYAYPGGQDSRKDDAEDGSKVLHGQTVRRALRGRQPQAKSTVRSSYRLLSARSCRRSSVVAGRCHDAAAGGGHAP